MHCYNAWLVKEGLVGENTHATNSNLEQPLLLTIKRRTLEILVNEINIC